MLREKFALETALGNIPFILSANNDTSLRARVLLPEHTRNQGEITDILPRLANLSSRVNGEDKLLAIYLPTEETVTIEFYHFD